VRDIGVAGQHVGEGEARVVVLQVPTAWEALSGGEAAFEAFGGLQRHGAEGFLGMLLVHGGFETLGDDVQVVAGGFGVLDGLLGGRACVGFTGVGARTTPGTLAGGEDAIDHVDPVEEGVDDEHDRVEPDFEAAQLGAEVEHEEPVEAEGDSDEADGKILDLIGGGDDREDHDEEEKSGGSNGVLHEADDAEEWVSLP